MTAHHLSFTTPGSSPTHPIPPYIPGSSVVHEGHGDTPSGKLMHAIYNQQQMLQVQMNQFILHQEECNRTMANSINKISQQLSQVLSALLGGEARHVPLPTPSHSSACNSFEPIHSPHNHSTRSIDPSAGLTKQDREQSPEKSPRVSPISMEPAAIAAPTPDIHPTSLAVPPYVANDEHRVEERHKISDTSSSCSRGAARCTPDARVTRTERMDEPTNQKDSEEAPSLPTSPPRRSPTSELSRTHAAQRDLSARFSAAPTSSPSTASVTPTRDALRGPPSHVDHRWTATREIIAQKRTPATTGRIPLTREALKKSGFAIHARSLGATGGSEASEENEPQSSDNDGFSVDYSFESRQFLRKMKLLGE